MSLKHPELNLSSLSLSSSSSQNDDWDRSLELSSDSLSSSMSFSQDHTSAAPGTPRNSIAFPADGDVNTTPKRNASSAGASVSSSASGSNTGSMRGPGGAGLGMTHEKGKRSLSELMKLHAEKGTEPRFTLEEASRVAEVLGQWINAGSSPYEGEDDFFARSQDDLDVPWRPASASAGAMAARQRGQSESITASGRQGSS
ncbi:hypothetical protein HGRIS_009570 [Hohenbuehelia grisea]|uniref:Uncharacterized protein n=1 Tax=Hohenbuehelia grisea TaxID=104357 RepID=A0ABR3J1K7_9AGAR